MPKSIGLPAENVEVTLVEGQGTVVPAKFEGDNNDDSYATTSSRICQSSNQFVSGCGSSGSRSTTSSRFQNLSPEQDEMRKAKMRERMRRKRAEIAEKETPEEREERLAKQREYARYMRYLKRAQASEEEREEFIRRQRETTSQRRAMQKAMETEEQRAERLKRQREYKRMRRQQLKEIREATTGDLMGLPSKLRSRVYAELRRTNETPEEREERLRKQREYAREKRSAERSRMSQEEIDEQKRVNREMRRLEREMKRAEETEEERMERLKKQREYTRQKRWAKKVGRDPNATPGTSDSSSPPSASSSCASSAPLWSAPSLPDPLQQQQPQQQHPMPPGLPLAPLMPPGLLPLQQPQYRMIPPVAAQKVEPQEPMGNANSFVVSDPNSSQMHHVNAIL